MFESQSNGMGNDQSLQQYISEMPTGDSKKVSKLINDFVESDLASGRAYYETIWAHAGAVDSTLSVSRGVSYADNTSNIAEDPDSERIKLGEAQNQLETMKSLFKDSLLGKGDFYKINPSKGETQNRCDIIKSGLDTILAKNKFTEVAVTAINDFLLYKYCCIKTFSAIKKKFCTRRVEVQYGTAEYEELNNSPMAYVIDDSALVNYQNMMMSAQSMGGQPMGGFQQEPDLPLVTFMLREEYVNSEVQLSNISPKNICFSDGINKFDDQPAVHEAHYWTIYELESNSTYFKNLEMLYNQRGDVLDQMQDKITAAPNISGFGTSPNFGRKEVWESWITLPFERWLKSQKVTEGDLRAFEEEYGLEEGETTNSQRWCLFRCKNLLLCILPNSRTDKFSHPYHCATFRDLKLNTCGESFYDIIIGLCKRLDMAMQDLAYNTAVRGAQPVIYNGRLGIDENKARKMRLPRSLTAITPNINDLRSCFYSLDTPDISQSLESYIGFLGSRIDQVGVNQTMLGVDKSRSATGAAINQQYGNIRIKGPFDQLCKVISDCLRDVLHSFLLLSNKKTLYNLLGDSYAVLNPTLQDISSDDIDKKFQLEMTCSFSNPALMVQQMITLANIYLGVMSPELMKEWMIVTAEMMGIPKNSLDRISDSIGMSSNAKAELETILNDPTADVASQIRVTDNHQQCLDLARLYSMKNPKLVMQRNFADYVEAHMILLQQQMMMQQQQMMANGVSPNSGGDKSNESSGSSMKPPENGGDENSTQRQLGQAASPQDSGTETSGGLTGTNSTPQFGNRLEG